MKDEDLKWSTPYRLFNSAHHLNMRGKPGVYRIRACTKHGEPLPIGRLGRVDPLGILHIGKSNNLGTRIRMFRQAAEGLKASHHAGREFFKWHFEELIPHECLRFDCTETTTEREALKLDKGTSRRIPEKILRSSTT